jgi:AraC-like DNA-binding protein
VASRRPPSSLEALGLSTALLRPIVSALRSAGYPCDEIELPAHDDDTIGFVPGDVADRFLDSAAAALGDVAIGITLAERLPIGSLGMLDYALCMSANMGEALQRVQRFYAYATQRARMELTVDGARATLAWTRVPGARQSRHWVEFAPAIVAQRMRQTLPVEPSFLDVAFSHSPPADDAEHRRHFGAVRFDAAHDLLAFEASLLELPLQTASASFAGLLDARMKEITPAVDVDPFLVKVRAAIVRRLDARETSLAAAAEELSSKSRTLQRALQARGTSHARLLDEARRTRAMRLLEEGQLSLSDVAIDLGFSEPSAFFRAFRRWTGTSPTLARQSHAGLESERNGRSSGVSERNGRSSRD